MNRRVFLTLAAGAITHPKGLLPAPDPYAEFVAYWHSRVFLCPAAARLCWSNPVFGAPYGRRNK